MKKEDWSNEAKVVVPAPAALESSRKPRVNVLPRLLIALVVALCLLALVIKQAF